MKTLKSLLKITFTTLLFTQLQHTTYAHGHLHAGATGTNQNDQLIFTNPPTEAITLTFTNAGTYAGFFAGNITFDVLPATVANGGPAASHPALGSFIIVEFVSVTGPTGGIFGFWEDEANSPTFSLMSGQTGTNRWDQSEDPAGTSATADPFGHIHGRQFTATLSGLYTVGFKLYDTSTWGTAGGPIHTPSDTLFINFIAVPEPGSLGLFVSAVIMLVGYRKFLLKTLL